MITMKRLTVFLTLMAGGLLTFTSCSTEEGGTNGAIQQSGIPIEFGSYIGRNVQTRAEDYDISTIQKNGIKVFAFYTETQDWSAYSTSQSGELTPNFMNMQDVTYSSENQRWTYTPLKYWPNNAGDKLSFFAYHNPYVTSDKTTYSSPNFAGARSYLVYTNDDPSYSKDLVYAEPVLDQTKPDINSKITFTFKHAYARIKLSVAYAADAVDQGTSTIGSETAVSVQKVLLGDATDTSKQFYANAVLNLFGTEGTNQGDIWSKKGESDTYTKYHQIFWSDGNTDANRSKCDFVENVYKGVTNEYQQLTSTDHNAYVIPQTFTDLPISITYTVTTTDSNLTGGVSTIKNTVSGTIPSLNLEAGKSYNIKILLGLTSVKFDVDSVDDWGTDNTVDVSLPANTTNN